MAAGIAVNALGYGRKDLAQIMSRQAEKIIHCSNLYSTVPTLTLAQKLTAASGFDAVFFGNSGTEANEAALKFARTAGALSVTPNEKYQKSYRPLLPECHTAPFNDIQALESILNESFAAVIVEPIQGEGGINVMTTEFAAKLNELCARFDIVLIADEIQAGLARTGFVFASAACGLKPDIITLGKPIAGGLPLGAALVKAKINEAVHPGDHGSTFGGNPVCCAVANAVTDILLNPNFLEEVREKGTYLTEKLTELKERHPDSVAGIRGVGLIQGIVLKDKNPADVIEACEKNGLILLRAGADVLRLVPPLIISKEEIDEGTGIIDRVLSG